MDGTQLVSHQEEEELKASPDRHKHHSDSLNELTEVNETEGDSGHSQDNLNHDEDSDQRAANAQEVNQDQYADLHGPLYSSQDTRISEIEGMMRTQFVCYICILNFRLLFASIVCTLMVLSKFFPLKGPNDPTHDPRERMIGFFSLEAEAVLQLFESLTGLLGFKRKSIEITNVFRLAMLVRIIFFLFGFILKAEVAFFPVMLTGYLYLLAQRFIAFQKELQGLRGNSELQLPL